MATLGSVEPGIDTEQDAENQKRKADDQFHGCDAEVTQKIVNSNAFEKISSVLDRESLQGVDCIEIADFIAVFGIHRDL
ncbi:hypothetical protein D3C83_140340 [compost metagenome]